MSLSIRMTILIAALVAWLPAQAQFLGFGFESNIELTKHDLDIIRSTVNAQVHGQPVDTTASWSNSESGNYGTVKLLKKFVNNGQHCETVGYTLATKRMATPPEHYMLTSCQQPNGQWRIM